MIIGRLVSVVLMILLLAACGSNPYLEASLDPAKFQGKDKAWFEDNWGSPSGKSQRFFGGETWVYHRIAGGEKHFPFFNFSPNSCEITLDFDKDEKLDSYDTSDC
ncbi:MAG: hypothetical protein ACPGYT_02310 [Nitrospirales bacterium]